MARSPSFALSALAEEPLSGRSALLRIAVGVLLVIHGVAHLEMTRVWGVRESASSWLPGLADSAGAVLSTVALVGFVLAGLAVLAGRGGWRSLAAAAAAVSLVTIALYWDWRMTFGGVVDAAILVLLLLATRPAGDRERRLA